MTAMSDFVVAHETESFDAVWDRTLHVGCEIYLFSVRDVATSRSIVPRMDLWEKWREKYGITLPDLFAMFILCNGQRTDCDYLKRCGKYIADLYGPGFQERVTYRYEDHVQRIVHDLIFESVPASLIQQMASALGIWIARCLPEDMLIGGKEGGPEMLVPGNVPVWILGGQAQIHFAPFHSCKSL